MIRDYLRRAYRTVLPVLYARSQFKLFLKMAIGDVDVRLQQVASAMDWFSNAVRPIPIQAPFGRSMLVLAPHQDDETIGCGGALALQIASGNAAHIVLLQDGADGCEELGYTRAELTELRNAESRHAASVIGLAEPRFLNHTDLARESGQAARELAALIEQTRTDVIFAPFPLDGHPDHRIANYILADALKQTGGKIRVLAYEVWGFTIPNVIVVIDSVMEQKLAMLRCFAFANKAVDYVDTTRGINLYRARLLGAGMCKYAECFFECPSPEYIELVETIRRAEKPSARED